MPTQLLAPDQTLTDQWHAIRRQGIGGSDVLATFGNHPYKSALQLWSEKVHGATITENARMRHGRELEPIADAAFRRLTKINTEATGLWQHDDHPIHLANPDRFTDDGGGLEIKTTAPENLDQWHHGPPDLAAAQAQWCMHVTGRPHWWVACWSYGNPLIVHKVARDDDLISWYSAAVDTFWKYVADRRPPPAEWTAADLDTINASFRTSVADSTITADTELQEMINQRHDLSKQVKALEKRITALDGQIRLAIGEHEIVVADGTGRTVATWIAHVRSGLDARQLAVDHPEIAAQYRTITAYRSFLTKGAK